MHLPVQGGVILTQSDKDRNFYTVRLVESGSAITAAVSQRSRGASDRYEPGDHVIVNYAFSAWFITDLLPRFDTKKAAAPRQGSLAPGDAFYGNAVTSAGVHVTGGTVAVEGSGVDKDGKQRRAAGTYWIPDYDAIRNICRRFEMDAAAGNVQMLHDDLTNNSCARLWMRSNATTGLDGRVSRIQMGYHRKPIGANFSIYTFPPGPDPISEKADFDFKLDPEVELEPFGGQWPKLERDDWQTRYYVMLDGTAIFESALVPAPSITPTTPAQVNVKVIVSPEGLITTDAKQLVTLTAMENLIKLKNSYTMIAESLAIIKAPLISVLGDEVFIGDVEKSLRLCNSEFWVWTVLTFLEAYRVHTHADAQGGVTGPPIQPVADPDPDVTTTINTQAS